MEKDSLLTYMRMVYKPSCLTTRVLLTFSSLSLDYRNFICVCISRSSCVHTHGRWCSFKKKSRYILDKYDLWYPWSFVVYSLRSVLVMNGDFGYKLECFIDVVIFFEDIVGIEIIEAKPSFHDCWIMLPIKCYHSLFDIRR